MAYEELTVGDSFDVGGRTLSPADLNNYIALSANNGQGHVNKLAAQEAGHRERVVHGFVVMAIQQGLSHAVFQRPGGGLYGYDRIRFTQPVYVGDTIELTITVDEKEEYDEDRGLVSFKREVFNQDGDLVVIATSKHLVAKGEPDDGG